MAVENGSGICICKLYLLFLRCIGTLTLLSNSSVFDKPPADLAKSVRVPIQRKNEKYTLQIQIPDPFSTAIISARWDGIYHNRRHVRR